MKKAIINYINARARALLIKARGCQHDWELISQRDGYNMLNKKDTWGEWLFRCKKCGKINKFSNEIE